MVKSALSSNPNAGSSGGNAMRKADWRGTAITRNLNDVVGYTPLGEAANQLATGRTRVNAYHPREVRSWGCLSTRCASFG